MDLNVADNSKSRIFNLSKSAVYQEGSIVSREVLKNNGGSVTIFAFGKGQKLSEHTTPFDALVYVFDGEAEIVISGNANRLKSGDMIIMPANDPHSVSAVEDFKMVLIMLKK
jgi:quercetin dioxygenase-like cupin family protein